MFLGMGPDRKEADELKGVGVGSRESTGVSKAESTPRFGVVTGDGSWDRGEAPTSSLL